MAFACLNILHLLSYAGARLKRAAEAEKEDEK